MSKCGFFFVFRFKNYTSVLFFAVPYRTQLHCFCHVCSSVSHVTQLLSTIYSLPTSDNIWSTEHPCHLYKYKAYDKWLPCFIR